MKCILHLHILMGCTASRKSHYANGNDKNYGSGTTIKKSPFTPYGALYASDADNNSHRNNSSQLQQKWTGLLTVLIILILLEVAS
ncbi:hypothetical protein MKW94_026479 [Papaver nudicaule]|uniref:Uncharacterized protein n=1 Tax=Papaver nudicaule TaxID=74823 RepID=A0AA42B2F3_PAPNU|nr:hypothetical protein [Papaver nudicaule]